MIHAAFFINGRFKKTFLSTETKFLFLNDCGNVAFAKSQNSHQCCLLFCSTNNR